MPKVHKYFYVVHSVAVRIRGIGSEILDKHSGSVTLLWFSLPEERLLLPVMWFENTIR